MNEERERFALLSGEDTCRSKCGFLDRPPEAWECRTCEHEKCWHEMRRNEQIAYRYESSDLDEILCLLEQGLTFNQVSLNIGHHMEYISRKRRRDPEFKRLTDEARAFGKALNKELAG